MDHFDILAKFLEMYPQFHDQICQYAPNGYCCIAVWFKNGQAFNFTYFSDNQWRLTRREKTTTEYQGRYLN